MCASTHQVVSANTCIQCPIGCDQCALNIATNQVQCTAGQCSAQYTQLPSDFSCFPCPDYCSECAYITTDGSGTTGNSKSVCSSNKCIAKYAMNSADSSCKHCPANCNQCKWSITTAGTACDVEKCETKYAQNPSTFECINCPTDCDVCVYDSGASGNVKCLTGACTTGTREFDTNGYVTCGTCLNFCNYCDLPTGSFTTTCIDQQCESKYGRSSIGACETCSEGCLYCNIADDGSQTCTICDSGYVLYNGACSVCPENCLQCTYDTVNSITQCNVGQCRSGFAQDTSANDRGCLACPDKCSQCTYVSTASFTGTQCVDGKCDLEIGYALNAADGSCGACSTNCIACATSGPEKCDSCKTGYRVSADKLCEKCSSYCSKCNSAGKGKCDSKNDCDARYTLDDNKECKACSGNCRECRTNGAGLCDKCDGEYVLSEKKCLACPNYCRECTVNADGVTTECIDKKCYSGYGRKSTDKKCHPCPNNCLTCEDKIDAATGLNKGVLECTACASKFILNQGVCGACPINCKSCSWVNEAGLECGTCKELYTFDDSKNCLACPTACSDCAYDIVDKKTKCKAGKCAEGYGVATDGSCKRCSELTYSNCALCTDVAGNGTDSTSTCLECANGYTMQDDRLACLSCQISPTSNCMTCVDPPGKYCESCTSDFKKSKNRRVCGYSCDFCSGSDCENPSVNRDSEVCASCWVIGTIDGQDNVNYVRGCSNTTCDSNWISESCQDIENYKECKKCCTGEKCNNFKLNKLRGSAMISTEVSIFTVLIAAILASILQY